MQIDFHHAVTYVLARIAGFNHARAGIISHAAQYVDDATHSGEIKFKTGAMYYRISSAHKMLDYRNLEELANARVWIPFHFLPGNGGLPAGKDPDGKLFDKLICRPDSYVARDMVAACIKEQDQPYALHRLGITMHVYADTWAHQGFVGVSHNINRVKKLRIVDQNGKERPDESFPDRAASFFGNVFDHVSSKFVGDALPLGHGAALSYPDRPFLHWVYQNGKNKTVRRNNPDDFLKAAEQICKAMRRYREKNPKAKVAGIPAKQKKRIAELLATTRDEEGEDRHKVWADAIARGDFGFKARIEYVAKGKGSWKAQALGTTLEGTLKEGLKLELPYQREFLNSDWKKFHDALQAHRFAVLHEILPRYGITMG